MRYPFLYLLVIVLINHISFGQKTAAPGSSSGYASNGMRFNKKDPGINYSEVRGQYMWGNTNMPAVVFLQNGEEVHLKSANLNLYSQELYMPDTTIHEVRAIGIDEIKAIHFLSAGERNHVIGLFENHCLKDMNVFIEVMNQGDTRLLKRKELSLIRGEYDVMLGRYDYRLISHLYYFIEANNTIVKLHDLSKESLKSAILITPDMNHWLTSSNNKLADENEFALFLNYYNKTKNKL